MASWSAKIAEEEMSSPPPLEPLSPIPVGNSQDSITVQVSTTDSEAYTPIVLDQIRSVHRRRSRRPMNMHPTYEKPAPAEDFLFGDILCEEALIVRRSLSKPTGNRDRATGASMVVGPRRTIPKRTFSSLSSSPGEGLRVPIYDVQRGGPR